ncbi:MAG: PAS domain S-box protein [Mariprofundus sp.]
MIQRYGLTGLGVLVGLLFWPMEALLHAFVFDKGDFISNLFSSDPDELWMRTLITLAFIAFGWMAQRSVQEQHQLQARLMLKRDRLVQIIDTTYDAYVSIDEEGLVIGWNRSAEKMFGWYRQDALGRELAELIVPENMRTAHREGMQRYCATATGTRLYRPLKTRACHRDGSELDVSMVITPLRSGEKQEFFAFIRNLSDPENGQTGDGFE